MICYWSKIDSPIGKIYLAATDGGLVYSAASKSGGEEMFNWLGKYLPDYTLVEEENSILTEAGVQLRDYFNGSRKGLDLPLILIGTSFRKKVWEALLTIPYGETRSYGQIAAQIGKPKASRAVGQANHHNPISYFVP